MFLERYFNKLSLEKTWKPARKFSSLHCDDGGVRATCSKFRLVWSMSDKLITLMSVVKETLAHLGSNEFKIPLIMK